MQRVIFNGNYFSVNSKSHLNLIPFISNKGKASNGLRTDSVPLWWSFDCDKKDSWSPWRRVFPKGTLS